VSIERLAGVLVALLGSWRLRWGLGGFAGVLGALLGSWGLCWGPGVLTGVLGASNDQQLLKALMELPASMINPQWPVASFHLLLFH